MESELIHKSVAGPLSEDQLYARYHTTCISLLKEEHILAETEKRIKKLKEAKLLYKKELVSVVSANKPLLCRSLNEGDAILLEFGTNNTTTVKLFGPNGDLIDAGIV